MTVPPKCNFILLSTVILSHLSLYATVCNDTLLVPYTEEKPVIDGNMDHLWFGSTAESMVAWEYDECVDTTYDYADHTAEFRVLWSDSSFFVFVSVIDDSLCTPSTEFPWFRDNIEIFFDGGYERLPQYDKNDIQWRYVYGDSPGSLGNGGNGAGSYVFLEHPGGYNFELEIPYAVGKFKPVANHLFGFEIACRDNDSNTNRSCERWWNSDPNTWKNASVMGSARLVNAFHASNILEIHPASNGAPVIDGEMQDGEGWERVPTYSLNQVEGGIEANPPWEILQTWVDHRPSVKMMADANGLYVFAKVIDDDVQALDFGIPAEKDNITLYFDGGNEKSNSFDANDVVWRYVFGSEPGPVDDSRGPGNFVTLKTYYGWNLELAIPAEDLPFDLTSPLIGFDIACRDNDNGIPEIKKRWWSTETDLYQNPSHFGTARILGTTGTGKQPKSDGNPKSLMLHQNYPNPFNPVTRIPFSAAHSGHATLSVYTITGQKTTTLFDNEVQAGIEYTPEFDGTSLASGIYLYQLQINEMLLTRKMILLD